MQITVVPRLLLARITQNSFTGQPITKRQISDPSKLKELADDNFKFDKNGIKWNKVIQTGRKHCGKRRNCL